MISSVLPKSFSSTGNFHKMPEIARFAILEVSSRHVETVCLLSNRKPDTKVRIDVDLEDYYRIKDAKKNQD